MTARNVKVKVATRKYLRIIISKTDQVSRSVSMEHVQKTA